MQNLNRVEYTYGEIFFAPFLPILDLVCPHKTEKVFWDIGCGSAKPVALAAMTNRFDVCKGVEFLPDLAAMAVSAMKEVKQLCNEYSIEVSPIQIT